jgi:hypothetical protein
MSEPYQYAPMPPETSKASPVGPAPSTVLNAVRLMFINAGLSLIGLLVLLATKNDLRKALRDNNSGASAKRIDDLANSAITIGIVVGVVLLVLYVLLALQVRKGKNWARIVTWVLAGLGVLSGVLGLFGTGTGLEKVVAVLLLLVDAAIIVLLTRKPANEYFAGMRGPRY